MEIETSESISPDNKTKNSIKVIALIESGR